MEQGGTIPVSSTDPSIVTSGAMIDERGTGFGLMGLKEEFCSFPLLKGVAFDVRMESPFLLTMEAFLMLCCVCCGCGVACCACGAVAGRDSFRVTAVAALTTATEVAAGATRIGCKGGGPEFSACESDPFAVTGVPDSDLETTILLTGAAALDSLSELSADDAPGAAAGT